MVKLMRRGWELEAGVRLRTRPQDDAGVRPVDVDELASRASDEVEIVSMLIEEARGQIAAQLANADSHDSKALAFLGADVAGAVALITLRALEAPSTTPTQLDRFWWLLLIGAVVSAASFIFTISNRTFRAGPAVDDFYASHIREPVAKAKYALLTDLSIAITRNGRVLRPKAIGWVVGAGAMGATIAAGIVLLAVLH